MKPTHRELCSAILAIGCETWVLDMVSDDAFSRLVQLELIVWGGAKWELTAAGNALLPSLWEGEDISNLADGIDEELRQAAEQRRDEIKGVLAEIADTKTQKYCDPPKLEAELLKELGELEQEK